MDSRPPPTAALAIPDTSALRALSDADALQTLEAYLWAAAQISAILRERLLVHVKENNAPAPSFYKPGPRPDDHRDTKATVTSLRSPGMPFAVNTVQERIQLPPPRTLASPPPHWIGSHSSDNNKHPAPSVSTSATMKLYAGAYDMPGGGGIPTANDAPNHANDRHTTMVTPANLTRYAGAGNNNSGVSGPEERYNINASGSGDASSSLARLHKAARHSPPNSDLNADELLLTTAYGPDYDRATQHRALGPSALRHDSSEFPPLHRSRDEPPNSASASTPSASASVSSPTIPYLHRRSRANTISSIIDDSNASTPIRRGGVPPQMQTHVVDQHLMDLREDLQASRRDRQQILPHQHQYDASSRYGQSKASPPGATHHGQQQRPHSGSPPSGNAEFNHRQDYDEGRYASVGTPRSIPHSEQQQGTPISSAPAHAPQASVQLPPPMAPQQQQQQHLMGIAESNIPPLGRKVTPALTVNALGQRTCQQCHQPGRYKDGRCIEKWGPGPAGPGTVCDRCRKRMKRVERRNNHEANLSRQSAAQTQLALTDPQQRQQIPYAQQMTSHRAHQMQDSPPEDDGLPPSQEQPPQSQQHNPHQRPVLSMTIPSAPHYEHHPGPLQAPPQQQQSQSHHAHGHGHLSQMRRPSISTPTSAAEHHYSSLQERDRFDRERGLERAERMVVGRDDDRGVGNSRHPRGVGAGDEDEEDELVNDDYSYTKRSGPAPPLHHHHHPHAHSHSQIAPPTSSSRSSLPESQERLEQRPPPQNAVHHRSDNDASPQHRKMYDPHRRSHRYNSHSRSRSRTPSRSRSRSGSMSTAPVLMMRGRSPRSPARTPAQPMMRSNSRSPSLSRLRPRSPHSHSRSPPLPLNGPRSAGTVTLTNTPPAYASSVQTEETRIDGERQVERQRRKSGSVLSSPTASVLGKRRSPPTLQDHREPRDREREQGDNGISEDAVVAARKASLLAAVRNSASAPAASSSSPTRGGTGVDIPPASSVSLSHRETLGGDFVMVEQ